MTTNAHSAHDRCATLFWLWLRKPNWNHYTVVGDQNWLAAKRLRHGAGFLLNPFALVGLLLIVAARLPFFSSFVKR